MSNVHRAPLVRPRLEAHARILAVMEATGLSWPDAVHHMLMAFDVMTAPTAGEPRQAAPKPPKVRRSPRVKPTQPRASNAVEELPPFELEPQLTEADRAWREAVAQAWLNKDREAFAGLIVGRKEEAREIVRYLR